MPSKKTHSKRLRRAAVPRAIAYKPELNFWDIFTSGSYGFTPVIVPLSSIPAGVGYNARKGTLVRPIRLSLLADIAVSTVAVANWDVVRITIMRLFYSESAWTPTDCYAPAPVGLSVSSPYNRDFVGQTVEDSKMEILYDERFAVSSFYKPDVLIRTTINLTRHQRDFIRWDQAGASNLPQTGAIVAQICSDNNIAGQSPNVFASFRLEYTDS